MLIIKAKNDYFCGEMGYDGIESIEVVCDQCTDSIQILNKIPIIKMIEGSPFIVKDFNDDVIDEALSFEGWVKSEGEVLCPRCQNEIEAETEIILQGKIDGIYKS